MRTINITVEYDLNQPDLLGDELSSIVRQIKDGNEWGEGWTSE